MAKNSVETLPRFLSKKDVDYGFNFPNPETDYLINSLEEITELGHGTFGSVHAVKGFVSPDSDEPVYLAKKKIEIPRLLWEKKYSDEEHIKFFENLLQDAANETALLQEVAPLKIYNTYLETELDGTKNIVILMQLIDGKSGQSFVQPEGKSLSPKHAKELLSYLLATAACMQSKGIVHLDIKPGNIMVDTVTGKEKDGYNFVLVDWGLGCWEETKVPWRMPCQIDTFGTFFAPYRYLHNKELKKEAKARYEAVAKRLENCYNEKRLKKIANNEYVQGGRDRTCLSTDCSSNLVDPLNDQGFVTYLLQQEDLWTIAMTVLEMSGVDLDTYMEADPLFLKRFLDAPPDDIAVNFLTMKLDSLIDAMLRKGFDNGTIRTIVAIFDFENKYNITTCTDPRDLLVVLYDGTPNQNAESYCDITRRGGTQSKKRNGKEIISAHKNKIRGNNIFLPDNLPNRLAFLYEYDLPAIDKKTKPHDTMFLNITPKGYKRLQSWVSPETLRKLGVSEYTISSQHFKDWISAIAFSSDLETVRVYGMAPNQHYDIKMTAAEAIDALIDLLGVKDLQWQTKGLKASKREKTDGRGNNFYLPNYLPPYIEFMSKHDLVFQKGQDPNSFIFVEIYPHDTSKDGVNDILGQPLFKELPSFNPWSISISPDLLKWSFWSKGEWFHHEFDIVAKAIMKLEELRKNDPKNALGWLFSDSDMSAPRLLQ